MTDRVPKAKTAEEVDTRLHLWHSSPDEGVEINDYLGWTDEEYFTWVTTGQIPE